MRELGLRDALGRLNPFRQTTAQQMSWGALLKGIGTWMMLIFIIVFGGFLALFQFGGIYVFIAFMWFIATSPLMAAGMMVWHFNNKSDAAGKPWWEIDVDHMGAVRPIENETFMTYIQSGGDVFSSKKGDMVMATVSGVHLQAIGIKEPKVGVTLPDEDGQPKIRITEEIKENGKPHKGDGPRYKVEIKAGTYNIPVQLGHILPMLDGTATSSRAMLMLDDKPDELPIIKNPFVFHHSDIVSVPYATKFACTLDLIETPMPGDIRFILRQKGSPKTTKEHIDGVGAFTSDRLDILAALIPEERTQLISALGENASNRETINAQADIMIHNRRDGIYPTLTFLKESAAGIRNIPGKSRWGTVVKVMVGIFIISMLVFLIWYFGFMPTEPTTVTTTMPKK